MTQEGKLLLFQDLCARLPHGVECLAGDVVVGKLVGIAPLAGDTYLYLQGVLTPYRLDEIKPYLRSMDDMTEEEKKEYGTLAMHTIVTSKGFVHIDAGDLIDWLLEHQFNYRLPDELYIRITEENNPY